MSEKVFPEKDKDVGEYNGLQASLQLGRLSDYKCSYCSATNGIK